MSKLMDIEKKLDTFTEIRQDIHTKDELIDKLALIWKFVLEKK